MFRDSHIHFLIDGRVMDNNSLMTLRDDLLNHGITEVFDMGDKEMTGLKAREIFGDTIRVKTCGKGLYKKGGYGAFFGYEISEWRDIIRAINELSTKKVDFIKVINSGIVSPGVPGLVTEGGFCKEELKIICGEAGERGLDVYAHANSDRSIRNAVEAGVLSIEHGFFIKEETIDMMREKGVSWTPTVFAFATAMVYEGADSPLVTRIIEGHLRSINYAASIGLRLRIGTDSGSKGVKHGDSFIKEAEFFQKAGLTQEQIDAASKC